MLNEDGMEVIVLGRNIGTASSWDKMDECELVFYDFVPNESHPDLTTPSGCTGLNVDFNNGVLSYFDDSEGALIKDVDIIEYFSEQRKG